MKEQATLTNRLDEFRELIQTEDFLQGNGLSNEVNIRMFCYEPKDEMVVRAFIEKLTTDTSLKCQLKHFNLYHLFLELCQDKKVLHKIPVMEEKKGSKAVHKSILKFSTIENFANKMEYTPHQKGDVLLLTGVGEVFPFMRVHALLEKLQVEFDDMPIVVMYPGNFDGRSMQLFNSLTPNEYYRAFNTI